MSKNKKSIYSSLLNNKIDMISSPNGFTNWLHKEMKLQQQQKENIMDKEKKLREHAEVHGKVLNAEQKKLLLDVFNAGREVFDDFDLRYVSAWNLKQLEDLIDDMKDAFGIAPKLSEHKRDDGSDMPSYFQDHVWSDDPRAYKSKD